MSKDSQELLTELDHPAELVQPKRQTIVQTSVQESKGKPLWFALASAGLLWLCYFPMAWGWFAWVALVPLLGVITFFLSDSAPLNGWFAWVALVPLLGLVRTTARPRIVYLSAWAGGLAFYWPVMQWLRVADYRMYATWASLATYCSLFFPMAIYVLRCLDRRTRLPLIVTVPVVWTALEYLRAHFLTGFPWYFLSHTQHAFLPLIQIADVAGAYGVTFVVAAVNALIFEMLLGQRWSRRTTSRRYQLAAVLLLLAATLVYGSWRLGQNDFAPGPKVALIQGSLDQRLRNMASSPEGAQQAARKVVKHYAELSDEATLRRPDLIVWPETSYPYHWEEVSPELSPERLPRDWHDANKRSQELADEVAQRWHTPVLLGLNALNLDAEAHMRRYNSAVLIEPDIQPDDHVRGRVAGRYDKIHRVPFGEYVPLRDWLPWLKTFAPYDFDYSIHPGQQLTRFPLGSYHFGVVICYEDTDPFLARQYVRAEDGEPAVDFLLNLSNDGWFDGTSEHEQHLAICRFRAIECRRAVARAVNMGISAVIDGNGRVIALPGPTWEQSKKVEAVVTASIPIDRRTSLYALWGDWLPWACWLVLGLGMIQAKFWPAHLDGTMLE
jgi:apolipoprotein N-acyltransferase